MARPKIKLAPFNASEHLDSEEVMQEYLQAALEDPNPELVLMAIANVAKARGAGTRESLIGAANIRKTGLLVRYRH